MYDLPSQCKSEGSPGHVQTGEGNFGEGLVRLSVNRVIITSTEKDKDAQIKPNENTKRAKRYGLNCCPCNKSLLI